MNKKNVNATGKGIRGKNNMSSTDFINEKGDGLLLAAYGPISIASKSESIPEKRRQPHV